MKNEIIFGAVLPIVGCQFAELSYRSECGFPKKSGLDGVSKRVVLNVYLNADYENGVNRRLEAEGKEGTFKAQKLPFGEWYSPNKVIVHKGEYYLRFYTHKNSNPKTTYYENGVECSSERVAEIKAYLATKEKPTSNRQSESGLTDHQVTPKSVKFDNIESLIVNGAKVSFKVAM